MPPRDHSERRSHQPYAEGRPITSHGFDPAIEHARLRDRFAERAMSGLMSDLKWINQIADAQGKSAGDLVGEIAYEIASGMMKARNAKGSE